MNSDISNDQVTGLLRALAPAIIALLVYYGLDSVTAGNITFAVLALIAAGWSWYTNRPAQMAKSVAEVTGVQVVVGPSASTEFRTLAADPNVPGIVPKQ